MESNRKQWVVTGNNRVMGSNGENRSTRVTVVTLFGANECRTRNGNIRHLESSRYLRGDGRVEADGAVRCLRHVQEHLLHSGPRYQGVGVLVRLTVGGGLIGRVWDTE